MTAPQDHIRSSAYCTMVHLTRQFDAEVAPALAKLGITPLDYMVLGQMVLTPDRTPAELARLCGLSAQHLAGVLSRAERSGLVERLGMRGRGRITRVRLSGAGMSVLEAGWPAVQAAGHGRLSEVQERQLHTLLVGLQDPLPDADDVVVLVDDHGSPTGTADRVAVHTTSTPRHLAFSTYLFDDAGRVLLTRRALHKATWPGVWTNAACGHLRPGENAEQAAGRRVPQELGTAPTGLLMTLPRFSYRAIDASGIVENELCPVLLGRIDAQQLQVDPDEVAEIAWTSWAQLRRTARETPWLLSPWSVLQVEALGEDPWQQAEGAAPNRRVIR